MPSAERPHGLGLADFTTARLVRAIDRRANSRGAWRLTSAREGVGVGHQDGFSEGVALDFQTHKGR